MYRFLYSIIVVILCMATYTSVAHAADTSSKDIIIGFKEEIDLDVLIDIPFELHHKHEKIQAVSVTIQADKVRDIRRDSRVAWVEVDHEVDLAGQVVDWGHQETVNEGTRKLGITGKGIKVGIIDTGIRTDHPDLVVSGGVSFVKGTEPDAYEDDNGHGTHVAGIIAARDNDIGSLGVAPNAEIYAIKALDADGNGNQTQVIASIDWAIDQDLDILNLSLTGLKPSIALHKMIQKAHAKGIFLVAASGNETTGIGQMSTDIMYPARYPEVIGVGSVNQNLNWSDFSYTGPSLAYSAPGEEIYSTYEDDYALMTGTSMAAGFVTGVIALYKEVYPELSVGQIERILTKDTVDLGVVGKDPLYGHGLIQSPETLFWDMQLNDWYTDGVHHLTKEAYINGYPDGSFQPARFITRAEVVTMIAKAKADRLNQTNSETVYIDVPADHYASADIKVASNKGWVKGYPNNEFKPKSSIKRADAVLIIQRAFNYDVSSKPTYIDVRLGDYYYEAINGLSESMVINGYPNQLFKPESYMSRAQFAAILSRVTNGGVK